MRFQLSLLLLGLSLGLPAAAEDLEGTVTASGSGVNSRVFLAPAGAAEGPDLCASDVTKKVRRLGAMVVRASGAWKLSKKGEKSCFAATTFTVLKTSTGRDAAIGLLGRQGAGFVLTGDDGKSLALDDVPGGLKKLEGHKVILDLKAMEGPSGKGAPYKVVSYAEHP